MRRFIVFAVVFMVLFSILFFTMNLLSGLFLTFNYVSSVGGAWNISNDLPREVTMYGGAGSFPFSLLVAFLSAAAAYLTAQKFPRHE